MRCVVIHYHELAMKGRNRPFFEQRLVRNIRLALKGTGVRQVDSLQGRIRVLPTEDAVWETIRTRLRRVFGVVNFSLAQAVPLTYAEPNLAPLLAGIGHEVRPLVFKSFRVSAKRADKRFPLTSMDIERTVGAHVKELTGARVDLTQPELTIHVELLSPQSFFSVHKEPGPGGMPVGVSGRVACLLSGGIDSPVAAARMMKRGCKATFIHFHGRPFVSRASEEKVREIAELLTQYQFYSRLYLIPFGEIQRQIVLGAPTPLRVVLYRRMMVRIAEELARQDKCWGLVTGDSLGQVASQTPENLTVVEEAAQMPILRPLIGMDKSEITLEAQALGTFETSIEPDQDCCRLFVPPHPATKSSLDHVRKVERNFDLGALVKQGLEQAELVEFTFP
jgi:thiamine biosynthesis protein ThiI